LTSISITILLNILNYLWRSHSRKRKGIFDTWSLLNISNFPSQTWKKVEIENLTIDTNNLWKVPVRYTARMEGNWSWNKTNKKYRTE
jgi:hypothetical protein